MADEIQDIADAGESEADARFRRELEFAEVVADAVKRAEAMQRLELSLIYGPVLPSPTEERPARRNPARLRQ